MAENLKQQEFGDLDETALAAGIKDAMSEEAPKVSVQEANGFVQQYMQKKQESKFAEAKQAGEAFLKENAQREEVTVLPSGLQYEIIKPGSGEKPSAESQVKVHYHGMLIDGTVFDSSVERGEPTSFGVGQVIAGWTEALQLMPEGAKWKLYIPADLAYGPRGAGQKIGPYATLIFEVELLEVM